MLVVFSLLLPVLLTTLSECQESEADIYNVFPYLHVYPPTDTSLDQLFCSPHPAMNKTCPLYVALLMSFGGSYVSSGVIPGVQVALDQINSDPTILPGYTLHYTLMDSQCDRTTALNAIHASLLQPPTKIAVIGSGCSVATEPTAEVSHYYNVTQLSCTSSSNELMDRSKFPSHFQFSTSEISLAHGFFGVIQNFGWRKVSIIVQDENIFTVTMNELKRLLSATSINFTETRFESDIGIDHNPFALDPDARIFVLSMYAEYAREVLCMAYSINSDFKYPRYLFFVNGWLTDQWWVGSDQEQMDLLAKYDCSAAHRESLLPSTLAPSTSGRVVLNYSAVAENGYTGDTITSAYETYLNASLLNITNHFLYQLCYDTTWTLARALNKTQTDLANMQGESDAALLGLHNFTYDNHQLLERIFSHLSSTDYNGIVGNISFNANGSRLINTVRILQYRYNESNQLCAVPIGTVFRRSEYQFGIEYDGKPLWSTSEDPVPYDGCPTERLVSIHVSLTIIFSFFATCGIIFAIVCISLNIHFRNKKLIRLTSPNLNYLTGIGAIVLYINMYILVIPTKSKTAVSIFCNLDSWFTAIGYSLCYGTILAKMCRVYYIFDNPSLKKKGVKDRSLVVLVLLMVSIDLIIFVSYTVSQSIRSNLSAERVSNRENPEDRIGDLEEIFRYYVYVCASRERYITLGILYGYKALLQIMALIFAMSIRKVHIKGLNDAVYVIAAIYITSIVTAVVVVSTYTLTEFINVYATVFCLGFFIGTTVILGLVFIPPLVGLYQDPEGNTVFGDHAAQEPGVQPEPSSASFQLNTLESGAGSVKSLQKKILQLEEELSQANLKAAAS